MYWKYYESFQLVFPEKRILQDIRKKAGLGLITFNIYPFNVNYDSKIVL